MFSEDFCVFLHNHVQAPYWLTNECSKEFITSMYKKNGFKNVRRIKKFVHRTDIRKYLHPYIFKEIVTFQKFFMDKDTCNLLDRKYR